MVAVQNYHGNPAPPGKPVLTFQIGDVIELLRGDPDSPWWEVRAIPLEKFPGSFKPVTSASSLLFVAFPNAQGRAGAPELGGLVWSPGAGAGTVPVPTWEKRCSPCPSQADTQLGFAGALAADEEVGLFSQLVSKALPR